MIGHGCAADYRPCRPERSNLGLNPEACRSVRVSIGWRIDAKVPAVTLEIGDGFVMRTHATTGLLASHNLETVHASGWQFIPMNSRTPKAQTRDVWASGT